MWLLRPVLAEPPLCSIDDVRTRFTIDDVADLHEVLDLKEALAAKAQEQRERQAGR
jgi:hypothetical protein